jgi:tRNA pseudouridine38-40 synthase
MNVRLDLEFDGTNYFGWQYQPNHPTVQGTIEQALNKLFGARVGIVGVGRTDTGVSAVNYTANFHPPREMEMRAVRAALNQLLPESIRIKRARQVPEGFNARHSAVSKWYRYTIVLAPTPILRRQAWQLSYAIDADLLSQGAHLFVGKHDFAPFCRIARCSSHFGEVDIMKVMVRGRRSTITGAPLLQIEFQADRFLYKMVRRMVGALVDIGRGKFSLDDLRQAIEVRPLVQFLTAPAAGLVLVRAYY